MKIMLNMLLLIQQAMSLASFNNTEKEKNKNHNYIHTYNGKVQHKLTNEQKMIMNDLRHYTKILKKNKNKQIKSRHKNQFSQLIYTFPSHNIKDFYNANNVLNYQI